MEMAAEVPGLISAGGRVEYDTGAHCPMISSTRT
jgi:hypothetical protein